MSNDFLRSYTIPTVQNHVVESSPSDLYTPTSTTTSVEETNRYISEVEVSKRYMPGMYSCKSQLANVLGKRPHKVEPSTSALSNRISEKSISIFIGRDASYPDELNSLIKPLFCDLCKVHLNSKNTAISHYESKVHDRKIQAWLSEHYPDNPPPVKRFIKNSPTGPGALRCELCDLPMTSVAHAKQHYAGRKHRLVAEKKSDPSGNGYYDSEGKWVRTGTKKFPTMKNADGRFGIGDDFVSTEATLSSEQERNPTEESSKTIIPENLRCRACNIFVTSESQMTTHINGTKHKKKIAAAEASGNYVFPQEISHENSILATVNSKTNSSQDLSMYRTPTGSYYCQICNVTMNHESVLLQHLQGKKHKAKEKANQEKN